ncbi:hypothetical protein GCM10023205_79190 [Yinghuangia aomiensis]|uniref:Uncharacterized protein n=1 Tax=Yinghuangia aomiensis TaxID=676205 RepID=A0ABP9IDL2_9ACTN
MTSAPPALRAGDQLACTTCTTRVVVLRPGSDGDQVVTCCGSALQPAANRSTPGAPDGAGTVLGKRYVDAADTVELLCTFAGAGELDYGGEAMAVKAAKPLPASD